MFEQARNTQKKRANGMTPIRRWAPAEEERTRTCVISSTPAAKLTVSARGFSIMRSRSALLTLIIHAAACATALAQTELTVVNAQPSGEIAQLAQAAEV